MTQTSLSRTLGASRRRAMPAVQLSGVTKDFGDVHAVRGIDLEIEPGEIVAFLGPNGAGKTTTIDMVLGLSQPDRRRRSRCSACAPRQAIARGLVVGRDADRRPAQGPHRARDRRSTPPACSPTPSRSTSARAAPASPAIADRKVGKCSGGEQQRLRFAMALLSDPALLLLDEPTTGMDVEGRRAFWAAIRADAEQGRTVLFATHYLEEADHYADRIVLISNGTHRRRRHRQRDQGARRRPHRARHAARRRHRGAGRASAASSASRCAATQVYVHATDTDARRPLPAHRDRRPRPRDHRPRPRGRVPQPDRRRRPTPTDADREGALR